MLTRFIAVFIVLFWLTMTGLLVRSELRPGDSKLREVPIAHVVKLLLHHGEASHLSIYSEKTRLGHLYIQPRKRNGDQPRLIEFSGNLQFVFPGIPRQRIAWKGELEMEKDLATRRFRLAFTMHDPNPIQAEITVLPPENRARYELRNPVGLLEARDFSLDEKGAQAVLQQLAIDPALLQTLHRPQPSPPEIKALQSSMEIHGEKIDTYFVTVVQNGQTLAEFHVSQLGQILKAKTLIGYTLTEGELAP